MKYDISSQKVDQLKGDCLVLAVFDGNKLSASAKLIDKASGGYLSEVMRHGDMQGKLGQSLLLYVPQLKTARVLLVGCGKEKELNEQRASKIYNTAASEIGKTRSKQVINTLSELPISKRDALWSLQQLIAATENTLYRYSGLKKQKSGNKIELAKVTFTQAKTHKAAQEAIKQAQAVASGVHMAKELGNLPGNICTPSYLAQQAKSLAKTFKKISTSIIEEAQMKKHGMGALLAVAKGSQEKPKLITMNYKGSRKQGAKPIVLVGKGITFDSGGISIKPSAKMDEMKYDMCGAASVFGTMRAVAELDLPINVVGIVASAENMPGGRATKPGDVVTSMSGKTIEVLNTDAEGRLVLCDALTYCERFKPDVVIDIATLTGAMVVSLGAYPTGMMSNHQPLADELLTAGQQSYDRTWQLPLWEEYQDGLKSGVADVANISSGMGAGSITAACFLARFTDKYRWAHLDNAGTAWRTAPEKRATGRPVPMLTQYIINRCRSK